MKYRECHIGGIPPQAVGYPCADSCTPTRAYVRSQQRITDIVGTRADITARFGNLCGCTGATDSAMSLVFTGVIRPDKYSTYGVAWAQIGCRTERFQGDINAYRSSYAEVAGNSTQVKRDYVEPTENQSYTYQCALDPSTGKWVFQINGKAAFTSDFNIDSYWIGKTGTHAFRAGEILNLEDDMAGTASIPCTLSALSYLVGGGSWTSSQYGTYDKDTTDNPQEWQIDRYAADAIRIWDVNPR